MAAHWHLLLSQKSPWGPGHLRVWALVFVPLLRLLTRFQRLKTVHVWDSRQVSYVVVVPSPAVVAVAPFLALVVAVVALELPPCQLLLHYWVVVGVDYVALQVASAKYHPP